MYSLLDFELHEVKDCIMLILITTSPACSRVSIMFVELK